MRGGQRLVLIVGAVILLGVVLVLLSPGGEDENDTNAVTIATAPAVTTDAPEPATTSTAAPAAATTTIQVSNGRPVGRVKTIMARNGDRVRIEVSSSDTSDEVHLHGYDIKRDLAAGGTVRFSFDADAEGIFEMELEGTATQIAKLEVDP